MYNVTVNGCQMDVSEIEKRIELMKQLADFNEKLRKDHESTIDTILKGTQKVYDFFTHNSSRPLDNALEVASKIAASQSPINDIAKEGIKMMFEAPEKPVNPLDVPIDELPSIDNSTGKEELRKLCASVAELRQYISNREDLTPLQKFEIIDMIHDLVHLPAWNLAK